MYKTDNKLEPVELVHKLVSEAKHSKNESKGPYKDNKDHKLFSKKEMELECLRRDKRMGGLHGGTPPIQIADLAKKTMTDQQETRILKKKHVESEVKKSQLYSAKPHQELNLQWKELRKEGKGVPPAWTGFTIGKKNKTITPKEGLKISSLTEGKKTLWSGWPFMGRLVGGGAGGGGAGPKKISRTRCKDKESEPVSEGPHDLKEAATQPTQQVLARNTRMDDHIASYTPIGERRPVARPSKKQDQQPVVPVQQPVDPGQEVQSVLAR